MIRPYTPNDKPQLLELFRLNTPPYFAPEEEAWFSDYLDKETEDFFVVEEDEIIKGCGGVNYHENSGMLSWGIIHPEFQGKGIGRQLTLHRIAVIKSKPGLQKIVTRTSQRTYKFYEKMGFTLIEVKKDHWATGLDLYYMEMAI